MTDPTRAAEKVLDSLPIRSPADLRFLEEIAWERGALVQQTPFASAEARVTICRDKGIITISSTVPSSQRKRFSIAHELGHFELHRYRKALSVCLSEDINDDEARTAGKQLEQEANEFASALLMPERFFRPLCDVEEPSLDYIEELADTFDTSLTATALRYVHCSEEPVALVYTENQYIKWVQRSDELKERHLFIHAPRKLDNASRAFRRLSSQQPVLASTWFDEGKFDGSAEILEHSRQMPGYNAVLTLLWLDPEIFDAEDDQMIWL